MVNVWPHRTPHRTPHRAPHWTSHRTPHRTSHRAPHRTPHWTSHHTLHRTPHWTSHRTPHRTPRRAQNVHQILKVRWLQLLQKPAFYSRSFFSHKPSRCLYHYDSTDRDVCLTVKMFYEQPVIFYTHNISRCPVPSIDLSILVYTVYTLYRPR